MYGGDSGSKFKPPAFANMVSTVAEKITKTRDIPVASIDFVVRTSTNNNKIWDLQCNFRYCSIKTARKISMYVSAYDNETNEYTPHRVFIYEGNFAQNHDYSKTWTPCWSGKKIGRIKI